MNKVVKLHTAIPEDIHSTLSDFERFGFVTIPATDMEQLNVVRTTICQTARRLLNHHEGSDDYFMNHFQALGIEGNELNTFRTRLITEINSSIDMGKLIYLAFKDFLDALLGPDMAVQKSTNLVIQQPGDIGVSPTHRDAPPNSIYEIVAWVPLVDCYGTKGLTILEKEISERGVERLVNDPDNNELDKLVSSEGKKVTADFGSAIFFWSALLHSVPVNVEDETRWSLNLRYKNIYSPYGGKGFADHYKILNLSPLSQLVIDDEKRKLNNGN